MTMEDTNTLKALILQEPASYRDPADITELEIDNAAYEAYRERMRELEDRE